MKIGIIGCGKQAPKHIGGLHSTPGVDIVLSDIDSGRAQALAAEHGVESVDDVSAIFDDPEVVAVDICTPVNSHSELIHRALDQGKDFFCEKPLAVNAEEAIAINEHLQRVGRIGMVGFNYRYAPAMEEGRKILDGAASTGTSAVLGRITSALLRVGGRGGHQLWKHRRESGGGAINEMLIHLLDLSNWYLGHIKTAETMVERLVRTERPVAGKMESVDAEDFVLVRLVSESGIESFCQADLLTPSFVHYVDIQGENGSFFGSIQPDMPSYVFCIEPAGGYQAGRTTFDFGPRNFFDAQMAMFIRSIRDRVQPDGCSVEDSINLLEAFGQIRPGSEEA